MESLYRQFGRNWDLARPFLYLPCGRLWSYRDLERMTAGLSQRLQALGLAAGDRLACVAERSEWNIFLYLACMRAGLLYVPLNSGLTAAELKPIFLDAEPALIVCDPLREGELRSLATDTAVHTLDAEGRGSLADVAPLDVDPDVPLSEGHIAAMIFTSGTTGRPKGALLSHELLVAKARALREVLAYTADDKLLHALPLYHAHGLFMTLHCVLDAGASIVLLSRFDAKEVVEHLPRATVFSGVPTMYRRLLEEPALREAAAGFRLFVSGSAPLSSELFTAFAERAGQHVLECWGMSETMTNTANPLHGERRPGSAGKALPGVDLRVVDCEGKALPPGEAGAIEVGFSVPFNGYWRRPSIAQPTFRNGRIVTGDIGVLDSDGYLRIVGRTSDVIISGGYNVYPREVESALEALSGVARAAVFGVPHSDYGEAVFAVVQAVVGAILEPAALVHQLRSSLVGYKLPKALIIEEELPLTELGKIRHGVLRQRYNNYFSSSSLGLLD